MASGDSFGLGAWVERGFRFKEMFPNGDRVGRCRICIEIFKPLSRVVILDRSFPDGKNAKLFPGRGRLKCWLGGKAMGWCMLGLRWSVQSPLPASVLVDRIRSEPRWTGWRDGMEFSRFLICDDYPVEVGEDGFRFLVPSSRLIGVVCTGRFHPEGLGTRIDLCASAPKSLTVGLGIAIFPLAAVPVIGLWSVNPWIALGVGVGPACFVTLMMAFGFWWNAMRVRHRITDFLTRPGPSALDPDPAEAPDTAS